MRTVRDFSHLLPAHGFVFKDRDAFLKPGDVVTLYMKGLGEQRQKVVAYNGK